MLFGTLPLIVNAQERIGYEYDAAGYRISQYFIYDDILQRRSSKTVLSDKLDGRSVRIGRDAGQTNLFIEILGMDKDDDCRLSIVSVAGRQTESLKVVSTRTAVDFSNYPSGTYVFTLELNDKNRSWKFVKK